MTSAPTGSSYTASSPLRSSPLSNPPVFAPNRIPSPAPKSQHASPKPIPAPKARRASHTDLRSARPSLSSLTPSSPPHSHALLSHHGSPPLSRSHPLLGSYHLSLFHSRMSHAHAPHSLPCTSISAFTLVLGALGKGKSCPPELRCPRHLLIPFSATYYDLEDSSLPSVRRASRGAVHTPWTGTIDLESHYIESYSQSGPSFSDKAPERMVPPPEYPGYRVAPVGQLQIVIKTPSTAVKVFLVPYDLRGVEVGGRLLARERTWVETVVEETPSPPASPSSLSMPNAKRRKESLRYAIQLQFVCVASEEEMRIQSCGSSTTRRIGSDPPASTINRTTAQESSTSMQGTRDKAYYVSKSLKVIFTSHPPERDELTRTGRTDEVVPPSSSFMEAGHSIAATTVGFSPGSVGRKGEWDMVRRKWEARRYVKERGRDRDRPLDWSSQLGEGEGAKRDTVDYSFVRQPIRPISPVTSPIAVAATLPFIPPVIGSSAGCSSSILPTIQSREPSRPTTPTPTCTQGGFPQRTASPQPNLTSMSISAPTAQRNARRRLRRGGGSMEERELSERLRSGLKVGGDG